MSSLALIRSLCPSRDLLIGHGQCTSCVQRHLAAVAVRREGIDLGSLLCMRKTIPDLGLVVWAAWQRMCSTVNANEKDEHNTEGATWNTESLCPVLSNLACSSLSSCALIWLLFSDKRISGHERMWTSAQVLVEESGSGGLNEWCKPSIQKILICALWRPVQTLWCPQHSVARGGLPLSACKPFVNCHTPCLSADVRSASLTSHSCESSDPELLIGFFKASVCQNQKFLNLTQYQRKDISFFYY